MMPDIPVGAERGTTATSLPDASLRPPSAGMYEQILEVAADAIVTVNEAQEIVHFNRGAEQIFGYEKCDVIGKSLSSLLPERFRGSHEDHVIAFGRSAETARLMGHRREVFGLRKDGTEFPAEASILKLDAPDGRRLYSALVRDVTDRKRMDQQYQFLADVSAALGRSLDYSATLESVVRLPVPALADGCILDVREEAGRSRRLVFGRVDLAADVAADSSNSESFVAPVHDVVPLVARGQPVGTLTLVRAESASAYDSSDLIVAENFAARAALAIDNARLYQDARHATSARDEVLGVVSHDLRNPLSAIAMCSRVLIDTPPAEDGARRELAKTIHDSTVWMSRMIQDLLDVSAIEAGVLSIVCQSEEVGPILLRAASIFTSTAAERGVELTVNTSAPVPPVHADAERLVQAVANLVGNAVKFTPSGGTVTVVARAHGGDVEVAVQDTGRGIPEQDVDHIFDRYWHGRGSAAGTGLGLAIARGIVEAHGGHVTVTSALGVGSRFSILLPHEGDRAEL
jgi:PAS domain S-box-containing protein